MQDKFRVLCPAGYTLNNISNNNIDINIIIGNSDVYFATLFTIESVKHIIEDEKLSYFWSPNMLIIENLKEITILKSIRDVINNDITEMVFGKPVNVKDIYPNFTDINSVDNFSSQVY